MIIYKSMISSALSERQQQYPVRTKFDRRSLIVVAISAVLLIAAVILS